MASIVPRRDLPVVPVGRPSQNLGHPHHAQLDHHTNLPVNIFESNPLTINRGLTNALQQTAKSAQPNGGASGLLAVIQRRTASIVRKPPVVPTLGTPTGQTSSNVDYRRG